MDAPHADVAGPERRTRGLIALGVAATFLGLAIASTVHRTLGGVVSVVGWAVLGYAVHRLGRVGRAD